MSKLFPHPATSMKFVHGITQQTLNDSNDQSSGIDTRGFEYAVILVQTGTIAGSGSLTVHVEESSDDGSSDAYADVSGATLTTTTDGATLAGVVRLHDRERYIRVDATETESANAPVAVTVVLLGPGYDSDQSASYSFSV